MLTEKDEHICCKCVFEWVLRCGSPSKFVSRRWLRSSRSLEFGHNLIAVSRPIQIRCLNMVGIEVASMKMNQKKGSMEE